MSLHLMKKRIEQSGATLREEMIRDGQNLLSEELEQDTSYSPTVFFWKYNQNIGFDERPAKLRIYNRKYSSLNGNYQYFLTTHDNPVKIGDYIHDTKDDSYWLVYNSFNVNDIHYEGKMIQCNYLLKWQLADGTIMERWANIVSASKYDVGENGNRTIVLSSNNYTVLIGYCEEGFELEEKRVFIDLKPVNPTKVFKITRSDDVLYNSGNMGSILSFIADKTEFNSKVDNQELLICDYIEPSTSLLPQQSLSNEMTILSALISGKSILRNSYKRTYSVDFIDSNEKSVDWQDVSFKWNVISDFDIGQNVYDNKIDLLVDNEDCIGSSFLLEILLTPDNIVLSKIKITIEE